MPNTANEDINKSLAEEMAETRLRDDARFFHHQTGPVLRHQRGRPLFQRKIGVAAHRAEIEVAEATPVAPALNPFLMKAKALQPHA